MQLTGFRVLGALGISVVISLTAACGGSAQEAKAPSTDAAESQPVGSTAPELSTPITPTEPPKTSAVSSTSDGSDIIPPFSAGAAATTKDKDTGKKAAKPKKGASAKPKKKG